MNLAGKYALVTGAGRGIGKGCSLELARRGAGLVINDRPDSPDLSQTAEEIRLLGRECYEVAADVFKRTGCEDLVALALQRVPQIDILISNPAYSQRAPFLQYSVEDFERTLQGTFASGFHMAQLVARHMVHRGGGGKILFISSVQAQIPHEHCAPYGAAKAALNHLARAVAVELAPYRINVNVIEPGWIDTPGEHEAFSEEAIERESAMLPWGRMGRPEDIGRAAAFLASDQADYITGVVLPVDGLYRYKDCRSQNQYPQQQSAE